MTLSICRMALERSHIIRSAKAAFAGCRAIFSATTLVAMRYSALIGCLLGLNSILSAQNLVLNGSFEEILECPDTLGEITNAVGWMRGLYSPDLFSTCAPVPDTGVPDNAFGYQEAATGNNYAGLLAYSATTVSAGGYREILGRPLNAPLIPGNTYYASLRASWTTIEQQFACNNIGIYLTTTERTDLDWYPLPNQSQVNSASVITDSVGWTLVEGTFVATEPFAYVYVGNFYGDLETTGVLMAPDAAFQFAYYYIDDICVMEQGGDCLVQSVADNPDVIGIQTWPNPSSDGLWACDPLQRKGWINLINTCGKVVFATRLVEHSGPNWYSLPAMGQGLYLVQFVFENGLTQQHGFLHH